MLRSLLSILTSLLSLSLSFAAQAEMSPIPGHLVEFDTLARERTIDYFFNVAAPTLDRDSLKYSHFISSVGIYGNDFGDFHLTADITTPDMRKTRCSTSVEARRDAQSGVIVINPYDLAHHTTCFDLSAWERRERERREQERREDERCRRVHYPSKSC